MTAVRVTALEGQRHGEALEAQFENQIVLERALLWQRQAHKGPGDLEFERVEPTRLSVELVFDGTESSSSVQPDIDKLSHFSSVDSVLHRPPKVELTWGSVAGAMPTFVAVIASVTVRYGVFADNGVPLHAIADVELEQAVHVAAPASQ